MNYLDIQNAGLEELVNTKYDLCIFSSGYEKRARYLINRTYKNLIPKIPLKLCLPFDDHKNIFDRNANDYAFSRNGFHSIDVDSSHYGKLSEHLVQYMPDKKSITVLVDYTVMRRSWFSEILQYFKMLSDDGHVIKIIFSYSTGRYQGRVEPKKISDYSLVPGFDGVGSQNKDKFGIYSLGYEPISLQCLHDWVEPSKVISIIANPGSTKGSAKQCWSLNKEFIEDNTDILETPIADIRGFYNLVLDIIKRKEPYYDIVLYGGGPKPFLLGFFLSSIVRPMASNVYIKGPEHLPINVQATGDFVITKVVLGS